MKLTIDARLPDSDSVRQLRQRLYDLQRETAQQVNLLSEGALSAAYNAATTAPTTGLFAQGDIVRNKTPSELGTAGSKYVLYGWMCVTATTASTPAAFVQLRFATGN